MGKSWAPKVAQITSHFNIFRNVNDAHAGPVTLEEQIKAMTRFVRWHARQVEVGQALLQQLIEAQAREAVVVDPPAAVPEAHP